MGNGFRLELAQGITSASICGCEQSAGQKHTLCFMVSVLVQIKEMKSTIGEHNQTIKGRLIKIVSFLAYKLMVYLVTAYDRLNRSEILYILACCSCSSYELQCFKSY